MSNFEQLSSCDISSLELVLGESITSFVALGVGPPHRQWVVGLANKGNGGAFTPADAALVFECTQ